MKVLQFLLVGLSMLLSCSDQKAKKNNCNETPKILSETRTIKSGEIAPGGTVYSSTKDSYLSFGEGIKGLTLLYIPKLEAKKGPYISFQNDEVPVKGLWEELKKRDAQIAGENDLKLAGIYGCFDKEKRNIDSNYLIFINDGIVGKIYEDVCLESITELLIENYP